MFMFMHIADAFIQSDLQIIYIVIYYTTLIFAITLLPSKTALPALYCRILI